MNPQIRKYWAIVVHFGSPKPTIAALDALQQNPSFLDGIIVVSNSAEDFHSESGENLVVISPGENLGYAGAIRAGLGALVSKGVGPRDVVICMNNDIIVGDDTLSDIRGWWSQRASSALLGIPVAESGKELSGLGVVNLLSGRTSLRALGQQQSQSIISMNYVHGAIFVATYDLLLNSKGLAEDLFLYWEDVYLSARVSSCGVPIHALKTSPVAHFSKKNDNMREQQSYYLVRNGAFFLERHAPGLWKYYWRVANGIRRLFHSLVSGKSHVARALVDASRGRLGRRGL